MAWQKRGNHFYYYRSTKDKGCVTTRYLGRGSRAVKAAAEDTARHAVQNQERRERHTWEVLDKQVTTLDTLMTLLSHSTLVDAGFYKHNRGAWRKRRTNGTHFREISSES